MKKLVIWMLLGAWLVAMALAGCGQTGPLYLPKPTQPTPSVQSPPSAQPAAAPEQPATPTH